MHFRASLHPFLAIVAIVFVGFASAAGAQPAGPDTYGTGSWIQLTYPATDFTPRGNGEWAYSLDGWAYRSGGSNTMTCTGIHLPSGASWQGITRYTNDADASFDLLIEIYKVDLTASSGSTLYSWSSSGTPGIERVYEALTTAETVENNHKAYSACVYSPDVGTTSLQYAGLELWYKLQVSPAPGTATFTDVPTNFWAFQYIEALAASGITAGCGGGNFCPGAPVTRDQMAVFLAKALGLHWTP